LRFFIEETSKREIIVQLSLWDHFDISGGRWQDHPWNPENNVNIEPEMWTSYNDFYATLANNFLKGLKYQQKFVDKILSITTIYGNVLYNINNESSEGTEWENYWAIYINMYASNPGMDAFVTTMQFDPSASVRHV